MSGILYLVGTPIGNLGDFSPRARETLELDAYRKTMEGVYSTTVNEFTLDEAPMAYKSLEDIIGVIGEAVDIIEVLKPIYNFKASE